MGVVITENPEKVVAICVPVPDEINGAILTEDGDYILTEDGDYLIIE
jgi:hypothetical protein